MNTNIEREICRFVHETKRLGAGTWQRFFCFPPDFIGFAGHFPGQPVLPAVVQICMVRLFWSDVVSPVDSLDVISAKFLKHLLPDQEIMVNLSGEKAEFFVSGEKASMLRIRPCPSTRV